MSETKPRVLGIIPARFGSRRFFGKMLQELNGEPILHRTISRASQCNSLDHLIVVSGDDVILDSIALLDVKAIKTDEEFNCGTDRCAAVLDQFQDFDIIINIQGDQPYLNHEIVDLLIDKMKADNHIRIASLMGESICKSIDPSIVKVKVDDEGLATGFSRELLAHSNSYEHIGVYGFRRNTLVEVSELEPSKSELEYHLEQLRWMDHGYSIHMFAVPYSGISINTAADLIRYNLNPRLLDQL